MYFPRSVRIPERLSVIGAIVDVIGGAEDSEKARLLAKMSDISTRIVSLTVTEGVLP